MPLGLNRQTYEHLVAFKLYPDGTYEVIFDGEGTIIDQNVDMGRTYVTLNAIRVLNKHNGRKIF